MAQQVIKNISLRDALGPVLTHEVWRTAYSILLFPPPSGQYLGQASHIAQSVKNLPANARDPSSVPGLGGSSGEGIGYPLQYSWFSLVAQLVNNLPAMRETWVWSLGSEDSLEKGIPVFWPGELHGLYSPRVLRDRTCLRNFHFSLSISRLSSELFLLLNAELHWMI